MQFTLYILGLIGLLSGSFYLPLVAVLRCCAGWLLAIYSLYGAVIMTSNIIEGGGDNDAAQQNNIPVIDLANPNTNELLHQIRHACTTWGFFQLLNHGIPSQLIESYREHKAKFFDMPYETKLKLKRNAHNARGYFDDELTKRRRDWKEALDVGVPGSRNWEGDYDNDVRNACLDGYNQFPTSKECPNFREVTIQYFEECAKLSNCLARLMSCSLGITEGSDDAKILDRIASDHTSYLRMNYYPPCVIPVDNNNDPPPLGISPHRDAGFLTVLLQDDDCHSLQVARFEDSDLGRDNSWVTVNPIPGAVTINTGDMAMIWSNGLFRAPLHRVLTDPTKKRYSSPFFYNPGYNELISPLDCCCSSNEEKNSSEVLMDKKKYQPCLWGYFRALRFAGDLTDLGVEIQTSHFKMDSKSDHIKKQEEFLKVVNFEEPFNVEKYRSILESKD